MIGCDALRRVVLAALLVMAVPVSGCRGGQRDTGTAEPMRPAVSPPLITQERAREAAAAFAKVPVKASEPSEMLLQGWPASEFYDPSTGRTYTVDLVSGTVRAATYDGPYRSLWATVSPDVEAEPVAVAERFARDNGLVIPTAKPDSDLISSASDLYEVSWTEEASGVALPHTLRIQVRPLKRQIVRFFSLYHDPPSTLVPRVSEQEAVALATSTAGFDVSEMKVRLVVLPIDRLSRLVWEVSLAGVSKEHGGVCMTRGVYVDAISGKLLDPFGEKRPRDQTMRSPHPARTRGLMNR